MWLIDTYRPASVQFGVFASTLTPHRTKRSGRLVLVIGKQLLAAWT